ncbi:hypothetical protein M8818_003564 [Zalaria obscura]|uniref:Uncharacterized protein n=1 Tax=Zalaria obscura TaxID=2024903 RepID=A0ACC3SF23_9PEZI
MSGRRSSEGTEPRQDYVPKNEEEAEDDHLAPSHWWIITTLFPLIATTFGPLATTFNICALAGDLRVIVNPNTTEGSSETEGVNVPDPACRIRQPRPPLQSNGPAIPDASPARDHTRMVHQLVPPDRSSRSSASPPHSARRPAEDVLPSLLLRLLRRGPLLHPGDPHVRHRMEHLRPPRQQRLQTNHGPTHPHGASLALPGLPALRSGRIHARGGLGVPRRRLLGRRHALHHRLRRLQARHSSRPRPVLPHGRRRHPVRRSHRRFHHERRARTRLAQDQPQKRRKGTPEDSKPREAERRRCPRLPDQETRPQQTHRGPRARRAGVQHDAASPAKRGLGQRHDRAVRLRRPVPRPLARRRRHLLASRADHAELVVF